MMEGLIGMIFILDIKRGGLGFLAEKAG